MPPRYTDLVAALPATVPFVGPETQERTAGKAFIARLGANESRFGPSPLAVQAMQSAAQDVWMYGDPEVHELRQAIAKHHKTSIDHVVAGEGIDGLLGYIARLCVAPGDAVVTSDGAYPTFNFHVATCGGILHKVPYRADHEDPGALLAKALETNAKLIYLANPDNPMGTWHDAATITAMIERLPEGCLLVLDEAYVDLAPTGTAAALHPDDPRVIRLRTFSKGYGMAGLRVGYGIGAPALISAFDKLRNHFGLGRIAQSGALAALADQGWLADVRNRVAQARNRIGEIGTAHGLTPLPSATNFVALDCWGDAALARRLLQELATRGIFVRKPFVAPQDRCIRISAGSASDLDTFERLLPDALSAATAP